MAKFLRRVHFYHVTLHNKNGNLFQEYNSQLIEDDFSIACTKIQSLPTSEKTTKLIGEESYRLVHFEKKGAQYRGQVAKYRNNHMLTGHTSDDKLSDLALEEGNEFVEVTHFIYSPKKHVLSFEYNHLGPRVTAFTRYINSIQARENPDCELFIPELVPHPSVIERLKDVRRIKQFVIGIASDRIPTDATQGNLLRGMNYIRGFANAGMITVQLSAGTLARGESIIDPAQLMRSLESEVDLGILGKASIHAVTDFGDETIDLIDNDMVAVKEWNVPITTENFERWLDDITALYGDRHELIQQALRKNENTE